MNHRTWAIGILCAFATGACAQTPQRGGNILVTNWLSPETFYLPASTGGPRVMGGAREGISATAAGATSPLNFVAMTPCRLVDTRTGSGFSGAFGPPALA